MIGNVVRVNDNTVKICGIGENDVTVRMADGTSLTIEYEKVKDIPLSSEFFKQNGFVFISHVYTYGDEIHSVMYKDYTGPSTTITKKKISNIPEFSVTGIIVRTVNDWQNIMNICGCEYIADSIL